MPVYQVTWRTEPGLRGLGCSGFRATPTDAPDTERGVAVALAGEAEREALVAELESYFAGIRFSNNAAAFETVKSYVLDWLAKRR